DVRHNYGEHLLVDINSRYPKGIVPPGRERRTCCGYLKQGRGLSPLPQREQRLDSSMRAVRLRKYVTPAAQTSCSAIGASQVFGSGAMPGVSLEIIPGRWEHKLSRHNKASGGQGEPSVSLLNKVTGGGAVEF